MHAFSCKSQFFYIDWNLTFYPDDQEHDTWRDSMKENSSYMEMMSPKSAEMQIACWNYCLFMYDQQTNVQPINLTIDRS